MTKLIKYIANKVREFMTENSVDYESACDKLSVVNNEFTTDSRILDVVYNKATYKNEVADLQEAKAEEDNGDYKFEALMAIKRAYRR